MCIGWIRGVALVCLLTASGAAATDLTLSGSGAVEYDSNALRRDDQEEDDFLFRFRPSARIHEDRGQDFRYLLEYAVPFEFAAQNSELNDIDHDVRGRLVYQPHERFEVFASETFRYLRGTEVELAELDDQGAVRINEQRERVTLNTAELGGTYQFTPRLSGTAQAVHEFYDTDREDRAQNWLLNGSGSLSYVLTPRHSIGGGVQVIHQEFEETETIVASEVNSYQVFASWLWMIDETTSFQVRIGPALIDSRQEDTLSTSTVLQVPFAGLAPNSSVAGYLDASGNVIPDGTTFAAGALILAQPDACPTADMEVVAIGGACPRPSTGATNERGVAVAADSAEAATILGLPFVSPQQEAGGEDETKLNVFGDLTLTKRWAPNLHSALRYVRTQSGASGLGGSVVEDRVSLSTYWDFANRWNFFVRGDWSYRESLTEATAVYFAVTETTPAGFGVPLAGLTDGPGGLVTVRGGSTEIDTMRYGAATRVTHRWSRNTSFWGQLTYNRQQSQGGTLGDPSDFDDFLATVGVQHVFDPIKLW